MTKCGQKWPLNRVSIFLKKIKTLVLSGNGVKWKYLWSFNIQRKLNERNKICYWVSEKYLYIFGGKLAIFWPESSESLLFDLV